MSAILLKNPRIIGGVAGCVTILCCLLLTGCGASSQRKVIADAPGIPVTVVEVQPKDVSIFAEFAAQTYARDMVEVRGRVEGYIEKWLFRRAPEVAAGQMLYVLDLRPYEAAVQQAKGTSTRAKPTWISPANRSRCCRRRPTWPPRRPTW